MQLKEYNKLSADFSLAYVHAMFMKYFKLKFFRQFRKLS